MKRKMRRRKIRVPRLPSHGYLRREISDGPIRKESTQWLLTFDFFFGSEDKTEVLPPDKLPINKKVDK
ncbi:hypothetical protein TNCV_2188971 [Trichonephila clavipes]|nr:hypothetical protein TNCV_2188971 [Trichonephila clavipes]